MSRAGQRQVSFADWELMRQGLHLEPLLQAISDFLENQKVVIEQVRCDLTRAGAPGETYQLVPKTADPFVPVGAARRQMQPKAPHIVRLGSGERPRNTAKSSTRCT